MQHYRLALGLQLNATRQAILFRPQGPNLFGFWGASKKWVALALLFQAVSAVAQEQGVYAEQQRLIKAPEAILTGDTKLFGDSVNLYTGSLEFKHTDVTLPGNNKLSVAVGRKIAVGDQLKGGRPFGFWNLDIPHIRGTFSERDGWVSSAGDTKRCTYFGAPKTIFNVNGSWAANEFWGGTFLYVPGQGEQRLLKRSADHLIAPSNALGSYPVVTPEHWTFSCVPTLANDSTATKSAGEGFIAIAPDGTRYQFDWLVSYPDIKVQKVNESGGSYLLNRIDARLLPTVITDRFGNTVTYRYDPNRPGNLTRIESSDGRVITLEYGVVGYPYLVSIVSDGTRNWVYNYTAGTEPNLDRVILPDQSAWQLGGLAALLKKVFVSETNKCGNPMDVVPTALTAAITHPSGATASFTLQPTLHGRNLVPLPRCGDDRNLSATPSLFYTHSLASKTISGPGLSGLTWKYDYGPALSSWSTCGAGCGGLNRPKRVTETNPEGEMTRYTFGTVFAENEGKLYQVDEGWDGNTALRTVKTRYRASNAGPYPTQWGTTDRYLGDAGTNMLTMPVDLREAIQQATTFTWEATSFDALARATQVSTRGTAGMTKIQTTAYKDLTGPWIMGQVESITTSDGSTSKVEVSNTYNVASGVLESVSHFGKLDQTLTYHPDGTLATRSDGNGKKTEFSNYRRGVPQLVLYPTGVRASAVVNNLGTLDSLTDENGFTTSFMYDVMGRLRSIQYPQNDAVAWAPTEIKYESVPTSEFELAPGHWRATATTGMARKTTYYDGLWRQLVTETVDMADVGGTSSVVRRRFDSGGRAVFESYPARTYETAIYGVSRNFDALSRPTAIVTDSELGRLTSTSWYDPASFRKFETDARGQSTSYTYHAFDQPSEDVIQTITAPEGVSVSMQRDIFGKPQAITRSGGGKSLTRSYVYDTYERLCKTIEPETGATIQEYDGANNIAWRATGLDLKDAKSCNRANVPAGQKTSFGYDALNRLTSTMYGDGSPSITRTYTPDGLLETIVSDGAAWTYAYNKKRLNWQEKLGYGGRDYVITRSYDVNGSLSELKYPLDNLSLIYSPNALGRPRQVSAFAQGIQYHPDGAVKEFTYGNGIRHALEQNLRGLPMRTTDAVSESYVYDANGNPEQIIDHLQGAMSRTMTYDGLNRLKTASAPGLWGDATYGYDALDNLTSSTISKGANARSLFHAFNPTTNRLDSVSGGPAGFNFSYGYDVQGNITQRGNQAYTFDIGNRMRTAVGRATYKYDGHGRRVSTIGKDQSSTLQIYTQAGQLLYSGPAAGGGTKYLYLNNHQIAEVK